MGGLLGIGWPRPAQFDTALRMWGAPTGSREELLDDQSEKLRRLIRFAGEQLPYYRRLFAGAGVDPLSVRTAADLEPIPVSTRNTLRGQSPEDLMPPGSNPDRLFEDRTSGTTGLRLLLWREPFDRHLQQLFRMRFWHQVGVRPTDRMANISGRWPDRNYQVDNISRLRQALRIFRTTQISAMQSPEDILKELIACRPDFVTSYTGVIYEVARLAGLRGETRLRPRLVLPGAETLTAAMRQEIENSLHTRVVDSYGTREFNLVAWECKETGLYHVVDDGLVLEVIRNGKPVAEGLSGEVVITSLSAYVFPLIRYSLGDAAVRGPAPCPCGAPFSTLRRIQGRTVDFYYRKDGTAIHHWELSLALNQTLGDHLWRYQIVQESDGSIVYRLMPSGEIAEAQLRELHRVATSKLGKETPFEVRIEVEIPCGPSGKMLQSVNRLREFGDRSDWDPAQQDWTFGEAEASDMER